MGHVATDLYMKLLSMVNSMMKSINACWMREGAVASCTPSPAWLPNTLTEYAVCLSAIVYRGVVFVCGVDLREDSGRSKGGRTTRKLRSRDRV
jgi:hypothetical protein